MDVFENVISRGIWPSFVAINEPRPRDGNFPSGVIIRNFNGGEPPAGKLGRNLNLAVDERPVRD